jgi:hypothetical protein
VYTYDAAHMALGSLHHEALLAGNMDKIEKAQRVLYDFINEQKQINGRISIPAAPESKVPSPAPTFSDSGT